MAYLVDLEEEGDNAYDIPTTLIRSKADIAGNVANQQVCFKKIYLLKNSFFLHLN